MWLHAHFGLRIALIVSAWVAALVVSVHSAKTESMDLETAIEQATVLAQQGHVEAQWWLGEVYRDSDPPHDLAEAAKWYRKAATAGHAKAQFTLAYAYFIGRVGVPRDDIQAYAWFTLAASVFPEKQLADAQAYKAAWRIVCKVYGSSSDECKRPSVVQTFIDMAETRMTPDQIAEAQRMARELWDQHRTGDRQ